MVCSISTLLGTTQALLLVLFLTCTTTPADNVLTTAEYNIFRDIMVMLLLGFGFLMTFLRKYGLSAVGLTMLLTVIAIQLNFFVEPFIRFVYNGKSQVDFPLPMGITNLIDGEFSAATVLISFGAVIGRATPVQLLLMTVFQAFFYAINKVMIVYGAWGAEDVGGTITIHMFGAYFGIAVSRAFRSPKPFSLDNSKSNAVSDVLSLLGTGLLWVYWPSFVGATETASPANENHCVIHTILALLGSTSATFFLSHKIVGKFDPFHIANSTLAGGVAVGASARLDMTPGGALLLGVITGAMSVLGFVYVSPMLEARLSTYDSCGVHNLHGLPSVIGGLASAVFVTLDSGAEFLEYGKGQQAFRQILAVVCTIAFALVSGWATGVVLVKADQDTPAEYYDGAWWESEYLDEVDFADDDKSHHSRGSILPVMIGQVGEP